MPSVSKQQQKLMGLVRAVQKGDVPASEVSPEARKMAKDMKKSDVKDFASTKHKGLPSKVEGYEENPLEYDKLQDLPAPIKRVQGENTQPKPTNEILWKAVKEVCKGRGMVERIKMYEKKGGGWREGVENDEQIFNTIKELYKERVKNSVREVMINNLSK